MAVEIQGNFTDTVAVGGDGRCTVTIRPTNSVVWTVSQVTVEMLPQPADDSIPSGLDCNLRKNGYLVTPMVPNGDAAGGDPAIQLLPSDVLTVEWTGGAPGHLGRVMAIYTVQEF